MALNPTRAGSEEAAKEAALRILTRGPRTEREVQGRLRERGYHDAAVKRAIDPLRLFSLLDDRAFVRSFLGTQLFKGPKGKRLPALNLRAPGGPDRVSTRL